jgi:small multidrug resistance family-3 protein
MSANKIVSSILLFLVAGLCEIGGGWLVWQWLREGRGLTLGFVGGLILQLSCKN